MSRHERFTSTGLVLLLAGCGGGATKSATDTTAVAATAPAPVPPAPTRWTVAPDRFGVVQFGWSAGQLGNVLAESKPSYQISDECAVIRPAGLPPGTRLMIVRDTVMRVDVDSIGVTTAEGAAVGDAESRVLELYQGRVTVQPHKYTGPEGHYLVVAPAGDSLHRIIFETDGKTVLTYRAGRRPAVEYVEGCS